MALHEAGHVNGLGNTVPACSTSTIMATGMTKTQCNYFPFDMDKEAISLLYSAIPTSDVLIFRVVDGIASWDVIHQDGTTGWRLDGRDTPEDPWTEVAGVGPDARSAAVSGFDFYRLMEIEPLIASPRGYSPSLSSAQALPMPAVQPKPASMEELTRLLLSLESARFEQKLSETHPEKTRNGRKPWSEAGALRQETADYDEVIFTRSEFVTAATQQVRDYHVYWGFNSLVVDLDAAGIANADAAVFRANLKSAIAHYYQDHGVTRFHLIGDASDYEEMYKDGVWQQYWIGEWAARRTSLLARYVPGGQQALNKIPTVIVADTLGRRQGNYSYAAPYWFTDWLYGDVNGDRVPEAAVVRWPVSTNEELLAAALKMQMYNDYADASGYYDMALWVGDANYNPLQYDGIETAQWADSVRQAVETVAPGQAIHLLYQGDTGMDERLGLAIQEWNTRDPSVILQLTSNSLRYYPCNMLHQYYVDDWGRAFGMDMISALKNPLMVAASCQAANCVQTEEKTTATLLDGTPLCEQAVFAVNGPIAYVGPSMGTEQHGNYLITKKFMRRVYDPANAWVPMSDLFREALEELHGESDPSFERVRYDMALSYLFLGDALSPLLAPDIPTGVKNPDPKAKLDLDQPYPNPFNPNTNLPFYTTAAGPVRLRIYNANGQRVRTLVDEYRPAGNHSAVWDGRNERGQKVASGVYFARLEAQGHTLTKKITLLK